MKKYLVSSIIAAVLLFTFSVFGQNNNYPKRTVNGVECYIYTVQESEGLLAIGRKFEISADEISKANPYIKNGLKVGQQILIPIKKSNTVKNQKTDNKVAKHGFIQHKVEKKQTLFAISHKYNVSQEEIIKYNPQVVNGLHEGSILQIPVAAKESIQKVVAKQVNTKQIPVANQNYILYEVKPNETLFSICKRHNVEIADVVKLNPGSSSKLAVGTELKIPIKKEESKKEPIASVTNSPLIHSQFLENIVSSKVNNRKVIRIAFLLPFMLDQSKKDPKLDRFVNFYEGALIAIEQAKQKGVSFEIYTYDTENSEEKINEVLLHDELKSMDLIIGPAFTNHVPFVSDFAKENKVNTLIPFTSKVADIETNPYLFQFNPGSDTELEYTKELLASKYKNMHIVFANLVGVSESDEGKISADAIQQELTRERRTFSKINLSTTGDVNFASVLKKKDKNLIIFNTDKFTSISPYINSLISSSKNFDITLLEQFSWRNQTDKMPKCIYISPFNSDYNEVSMDDFNAEFDQYYGKDTSDDSPRYDILGYDLANYFITFIQRYGSKFENKLSTTSIVTGIQSQPLFERSSKKSGFINQRVYSGEDNAK